MVQRLAVTFLALALSIPAGPAPAQPVPAERQRTVILLRHSSSRELATALGEHFKESADARVVPETYANALLVSAPPAVFAEVLKAIEKLDRPPRPVEIEVVFADVTSGDGERFDPRELTGPADGLTARLDGLRRQGRLAAVRHFRLTTLEGQRATLNAAEERSIVTGRNVTATGQVSTSVMRRNVGTLVDVLPWVAPNGQVRLELHAEDSRVAAPAAGPPEKAAEGLSLVSVKTAVSVPAGRAVLASGAGDDAKPERAQTVVVVTARVIESGDKTDR
jgi:type II secretory pathway component GspD/PulD (secretin)